MFHLLIPNNCCVLTQILFPSSANYSPKTTQRRITKPTGLGSPRRRMTSWVPRLLSFSSPCVRCDLPQSTRSAPPLRLCSAETTLSLMSGCLYLLTPFLSVRLCQDHCYYHGSIVNDSQSSVSISTCDGLRWGPRNRLPLTLPASPTRYLKIRTQAAGVWLNLNGWSQGIYS